METNQTTSQKLEEFATENNIWVSHFQDIVGGVEEMEKVINRAAELMPLFQNMLEFLQAVQESGTPQMTSWVVAPKEKEIPLMCLWASVGKTSPFQRINQLLQQQTSLIEALASVKEKIEFAEQYDHPLFFGEEERKDINKALAPFLDMKATIGKDDAKTPPSLLQSFIQTYFKKR